MSTECLQSVSLDLSITSSTIYLDVDPLEGALDLLVAPVPSYCSCTQIFLMFFCTFLEDTY